MNILGNLLARNQDTNIDRQTDWLTDFIIDFEGQIWPMKPNIQQFSCNTCESVNVQELY